MKTKFSRMESSNVAAIVKDLDRWASGQLGSKMTWAVLEDRYSYSRQALQAKPEIKAAYDLAKLALSGGLVKSREVATKDKDELQREVARLKLEIADYQKREVLWKLRWQRIAYHIRARGIQMHTVDKSADGASDLPSEQDVAKILRPFDYDIPPSGRV
jgi:hypothetical protein